VLLKGLLSSKETFFGEVRRIKGRLLGSNGRRFV